jgi:hypothetical protein
MFICCECSVLSGRGLCDGLITRPEESYRLWSVVVCDKETSKNEEAKARYRAVKNTITMGRNARKTNKETIIYILWLINMTGPTQQRSWLRYWATNRKVAGSIPDGVIGILYWHNTSGRTMAWCWLSFQQKWIPGIFPGGKCGRCIGLTNLSSYVPTALKSGSLNLLEPSGATPGLYKNFFTFCTHWFYKILKINSNYCPKWHKLDGLYNKDGVCLLRGRLWRFTL